MYLGQTKIVQNQNRKFGSADEYVAVYLQNEQGDSTGYLFTPTQLSEACKRADENWEDMPLLNNTAMIYAILFTSMGLGVVIGLVISLIL